jgi:hypothetical protein
MKNLSNWDKFSWYIMRGLAMAFVIALIAFALMLIFVGA